MVEPPSEIGLARTLTYANDALCDPKIMHSINMNPKPKNKYEWFISFF